MRHKDRNYSFILSHTTKKKAIIRRIEVSKKFIHSAAAGTALFLLTAYAAVFIFVGGPGYSQLLAATENAPSANLPADATANSVTFLDYSRPTSSFDFAQNSGGPFDGSFQLTAVDTDREAKEIEGRLKVIESAANPRFLPTIWAHLGKINNEFGFRRNPFGGRSYEFHGGMDIDGERGDVVIAPANGIISKAAWQGGYGNMIEIDHGNGLKTRYGHLSKLNVKEGDPIQRGQLIGFVGSTGRSTGPHLHYELRLDEKPINPRRFLPPEPTDISG
jgi:murein DD-endopeptidase MepM/ murein hydrolase activator NlpD